MEVNIAFSVTITGTGFMTPQGQQPDHIYLEDTWFIIGTTTGAATATSFTANFPEASPDPGKYEIMIGFNDGLEARVSFSIT